MCRLLWLDFLRNVQFGRWILSEESGGRCLLALLELPCVALNVMFLDVRVDTHQLHYCRILTKWALRFEKKSSGSKFWMKVDQLVLLEIHSIWTKALHSFYIPLAPPSHMQTSSYFPIAYSPFLPPPSPREDGVATVFKFYLSLDLNLIFVFVFPQRSELQVIKSTILWSQVFIPLILLFLRLWTSSSIRFRRRPNKAGSCRKKPMSKSALTITVIFPLFILHPTVEQIKRTTIYG